MSPSNASIVAIPANGTLAAVLVVINCLTALVILSIGYFLTRGSPDGGSGSAGSIGGVTITGQLDRDS